MIKAFRDLLTSVDVLNTVNGGVSEPYLSLRENSDGHEVRVRIPGVGRKAIQVEIKNNELAVFYLIPVESAGQLIFMPQVVYKQMVPHFIEATGIKAVFQNNELIVKLPFNKQSDDYNRKIEIGEE
jgi:HSP20 family molecular chaperone IbpA